MSRLFELPMTPEELHEAALWWSDALQVAGAGFRARMDANAKEPPAAPPVPREYARHFRQLALPKLEFWARYLGKRVITQGWDYGWCIDVLMREAIAIGAAHLADPESLREHLDDMMTETAVKTELAEPHA